MMQNQLQLVNLRSQTYKIVKNMILRREIGPGEKIVEAELAQKIGISRTPLREALCQLEQEGIVTILPRRGAFVRKQQKSKALEILEIRETLEGLVVRLATRHIQADAIEKIKKVLDRIDQLPDDDRFLHEYHESEIEFHAMLLAASRSKILEMIMGTVLTHLQLIRVNTVSVPGRARKSVREHYQILEEIAAGHEGRAEDLMRQHIASVRTSISESFEETVSD